MRLTRLPLACALALAASGGLAADGPLRPEDLRSAMGVKLGSWRSTIKAVEVQYDPGPGLDRAQAKQVEAELRARLDRDLSKDECVGDLPGRLHIPGLRGGNACRYSRIEAEGGRFAVEGDCSGRNTGRLQMAVEGRYSPESVTFRSDVVTGAGEFEVRIRFDMESRFLGACKAIPLIVTPAPERR